jgi:tetratricopeptide (TPR) repeat protein
MSLRSSGEYLDQGRRLLFAGRAGEALAVFEEGARRFPGDDELCMGRALSLSRLGEHAAACEAFEDLKARNPGNAEVLTGLTEALLARGLVQLALLSAREAMRGPEGDEKTAYRLGRAFYAAKRRTEALGFYESAVEKAPAWGEAWFGLGACLWAMKRPAQAEAALRRAVELEPKNWSARQFLGCALYDLGRKDEAKEALEAVPYDAPWERPALERLVASAWWPSDPEKRAALEGLWRRVMDGASGTDFLAEVSRKLDA